MSSTGTVNGKGFVISYSVQSNVSSNGVARGGYKVTVDNSNLASCDNDIDPNDGTMRNVTANGSHLFFTSKIALEFTQGYYSSSFFATGSGSMKYILGS